MNNSQFLDILKNSFVRCLETSERSPEKLKILHGAISKDLNALLVVENAVGDSYNVFSLGYGEGKEKKILGRYIDKAVDITVSKNGKPIVGIAVKYVMSNYMQNSNNYFENMLGETANIRCNNIPYFQIFVIPDKIPYFDKQGVISKWESINVHNLQKYIILSKDNTDTYLHAPNKTLVFIINISEEKHPIKPIKNKADYKAYYCNNDFTLTLSDKSFEFSDGVVYNDYEKFIKKVMHTILSI